MSRQHWGSTSAEIMSAVVGDDLCPNAQLNATRSIDIATTPENIFPWIRQMGFGRAGWYSYDLLDNLGRKSATTLHPEWQHVISGDAVPGGPIDFEAVIVDEPRAYVLQVAPQHGWGRRINFTLAYELRKVSTGTRLVTRVRSHLDFPFGNLIAKYLLGPGDGFMLRRQLVNLARRAGQK